MLPTYDLAWILPYVRQSLRGRGNLSFLTFADGVYAELKKVGTATIEETPIHQSHTLRPYNENAIHPEIKMAVTEAFYYCEQNRFILRAPPTNSTAYLAHGQFEITPRGQEWAKGVDPLPEDYNGYMKQFPVTTDKVVREYMSEALHTFIGGTYFASAVMIGAASEKCIYLLADTLVPTLKDAARQAVLQEKIDARRLEILLKGVEQIVIDGHKAKIIPFDVMGGTTRHLLSLFDHIRLQRNDAIHPMNFNVSADSVRLALMAFPRAFERVDALRQWCVANPSSL
jgi:hypothetical protein